MQHLESAPLAQRRRIMPAKRRCSPPTWCACAALSPCRYTRCGTRPARHAKLSRRCTVSQPASHPRGPAAHLGRALTNLTRCSTRESCQTRGALPNPVARSLAKPLLVVRHTVPHVHAKHRLEVLGEGVRDVKAGDLRDCTRRCVIRGASGGRRAKSSGGGGGSVGRQRGVCRRHARRARRVGRGRQKAARRQRRCLPAGRRSHAGRGANSARDNAGPRIPPARHGLRPKGLPTSRMAWRSASQLMRSESTSTPSQSSTRYWKPAPLLPPLLAPPVRPPLAAAGAAFGAGAPSSAMRSRSAANAAAAGAPGGASPSPLLLSIRGCRMAAKAAGGRESMASSLDRCSCGG